MLVSEYFDQVIKSRPYKYSTKQTLIKDIKRMGIWDMDTSEITSAFCLWWFLVVRSRAGAQL